MGLPKTVIFFPVLLRGFFDVEKTLIKVDKNVARHVPSTTILLVDRPPQSTRVHDFNTHTATCFPAFYWSRTTDTHIAATRLPRTRGCIQQMRLERTPRRMHDELRLALRDNSEENSCLPIHHELLRPKGKHLRFSEVPAPIVLAVYLPPIGILCPLDSAVRCECGL